jgi:hypothetical protein
MEHNEDIAAIRERQRSGKSLSYAAARRDDPALVSAAEAYFGTWGNALCAAGINPTCICTVSGANEE